MASDLEAALLACTSDSDLPCGRVTITTIHRAKDRKLRLSEAEGSIDAALLPRIPRRRL